MSKLLYEVNIKFKKMGEEQITKFINDSLKGVFLSSVDNDNVTLIWELPITEGIHEIEEVLYYLVDDANLGTWVCKTL